MAPALTIVAIALASIGVSAGITSALCGLAHFIRSIMRDRQEEEETRILVLNRLMEKERDVELGYGIDHTRVDKTFANGNRTSFKSIYMSFDD